MMKKPLTVRNTALYKLLITFKIFVKEGMGLHMIKLKHEFIK
jgi:hypothetical protein